MADSTKTQGTEAPRAVLVEEKRVRYDSALRLFFSALLLISVAGYDGVVEVEGTAV